MRTREYRCDPFITIIGILPLLMFAYILLCNTGFLPWVFSDEGFDLDTAAQWILTTCLLVPPGFFLLLLRRLKVSIDDRYLRYQGLFKSVTIPWERTQRIRMRADKFGPRDVRIWTTDKCFRMSFIFGHSSELRRSILDTAINNSPSVVIEEVGATLPGTRK